MKTSFHPDIENYLVGQIISENIKTAFIFEKYGLKLHGNLSLTVKELKLNPAIDYENLLEELIKNMELKDIIVDYKNASTDLIVDYIEQYHHSRLKSVLPVLLKKGKVLSELNDHQIIKDLYSLIFAMAEDIYPHMDMEEKKLFPVIRTYLHYKDDLCNIKELFREKINVAFLEHEEASGLLKEINKLCDSYDPPEDLGKDGKEYFRLVRDFSDDMYEHIMLEEQILFPRLADF